MDTSRVILSVTFVLLIWLKEGTALSCYQCDSNNNPDCSEQFDHGNRDTLTTQSEDCAVDSASYCIKTTGVWGGVVGTTRYCSSRDMGNQCQYIRYPDHDRVYRACIYTCTRDHCNGAHRIATASLLPVAIATVVAAILRWS